MSRDVGRVGAAVVWFDKRLDKQRKKQRFFGKHKDLFDAELWAISDALDLGSKKTRNAKPTTVTIFTDSQTAMTKILDPKTKVGGDAVQNLVYQSAQAMKNAGHTVVLRQIPGHSNILGNKKADEAAKNVANKGERETDHQSSLAQIKAYRRQDQQSSQHGMILKSKKEKPRYRDFISEQPKAV